MSTNKLKTDINVAGTNWNVQGVNNNHQNEEDFVTKHMADSGTYEKMPKDEKIKNLRLAYKMVQENTPPSEVAPTKTSGEGEE